MTNQQAKKIFNQIAAAHRGNGNANQAARIELAREYFTNLTFRRALEDHVYSINQRLGE